MTLLLLSGITLAFQCGVICSKIVKRETQGYLDLNCNDRPKCCNQDSNWIGNLRYMCDLNFDATELAGQSYFQGCKVSKCLGVTSIRWDYQRLNKKFCCFLRKTLKRKQRLFLLSLSSLSRKDAPQFWVNSMMEVSATQRLDWDQTITQL